jgi:hypothetical protein
VLTDDGLMVITTPNPFALPRVRAGWAGRSWENVDHLAWSFPSGIVELAHRHGLDLVSAQTAGPNADPRFGAQLSGWRRGLRRRVSLAARQRQRPSRFLKDHEPPLHVILGGRLIGTSGSAWLGETAIYVVRRSVAS